MKKNHNFFEIFKNKDMKTNNLFKDSIATSGGFGLSDFFLSCAKMSRISKKSKNKVREFFTCLWDELIWGYSLKIRRNIALTTRKEIIIENAIQHYMA